MEQNKSKVLFAITQSVFGGAQRYVLDMATSLPKDRFDVAVVHGGDGVLKEKLSVAGIRTIKLSSLSRNINVGGDIRTLIELVELLRRERPNILHTNSSKMGVLGAIAGRIAGIKRVVFTAHGWEFNNPARSFPARFFFYVFSALAVFLSHKTIAVSEAVRSKMTFPFTHRRMSVVRNGVAPFVFITKEQARVELARRAEGVDTNALWVGTIAELHPVKGLPFGIAAFERALTAHPDLHYFVLGEGSERETLQRIIDEKKLQDRIHLLGFVENAATYVKAFDIFLLPSLSEGLSYAVLEAGAGALPIVASRVGGIPEVVEDTRNGFLTAPGDITLLSARLKELVASEELRKKLGNALREKVEREFSLEHMVEETQAQYH